MDTIESPYPVALESVIQHARRLQTFLDEREARVLPDDPMAPWIVGRAGEVQCVVAIVAIDWHQQRVSDEEAAARLGRYLREMHDGLAMHFDVAMAPCCAGADPNRAPAGRPAHRPF